MVKKELIEKSPLRILEKSIHGGVGPGNIGVIASRKGVGKTACLVHIATDKLFQDKHVIHISFSGNTDHILSWYEDIFDEIAKRLSLDHAMEVHDALVKYRLIMNFNHHPVTTEYVIGRLRTMAELGNFKADCIIIDGYDFYKGSKADIELIKNFAIETGSELWFSASIIADPATSASEKIPPVLEKYLDVLDIIIALTSDGDTVQLKLVKDHQDIPVENLHLKVDSKILLITEV
jgi:KaiC/GvpD/RAD55 family RecA-like ATPase